MRGFLCSILFVIQLPLFSQHGVIAEQLDKAKQLYQAEKYEDYKKEIYQLLRDPRVQSEAGMKHKLLIEAGMTNVILAQLDTAIQFYRQALDYQDPQGPTSDSVLATIYNDLGYIQGEKSQFQEQLAYYEKALEFRLKVYGKEHASTAGSYNNIGYCYGKLKDFQKQKEYFEKALSIRLQVLGAEHAKTASSYNNLGFCYGRLGDYDQELIYIEKALEIRKKLYGESHSVIGRSYNNLGFTYNRKGQRKKAAQYFQKALDIYIPVYGESHPRVSSVLGNLGGCYDKMGYHDRAETLLKQALELTIQRSGKIHETVSVQLGNLGVHHFDLAEYDEAISYFKQSLEIRKELFGAESERVGFQLSNLANAYFKAEDYQQALFYQNQARDLYQKILTAPHNSLANCYMRFANLYLELDSLEKAKAYAQAARKQFLALEVDPIELATAHRSLANCFEANNQLDSALFYVNIAIQTLIPQFEWSSIQDAPQADDLFPDEILLKAIVAKATLWKKIALDTGLEKDWQQVLLHLDLATGLIDRMRLEVGEHTTFRLSSMAHTIFSELVQSGFEAFSKFGNPSYQEKAFDAVERSRAFLLKEQIHLNKIESFAQLPDSLIAQENSLKADLVFYNQKIKEAERNQRDSLKVLKWRNFVIQKQTALDQQMAWYATKYPNYFALKSSLPSNHIQSIQKTLTKQHAITVAYFQKDSILFSFILTGKKIISKRIELPVFFDSLVLNYLNEFRQIDLHTNPQLAFQRFCTNSHKLYQILIAPISNHLSKEKEIFIIPDGLLGYLPFETLLTELPAPQAPVNYRQLPYLIHKYPISYSYHIQFSAQAETDKKINSLAFAPAFGPRLAKDSFRQSLVELHYAQEELVALESYFPGLAYNHFEAKESVFKEKAKAFPLLHLSTHSWIDPNKSGDNYLLFSPETDSSEDGKLHSYELYNLNLTAKMAVLSACNTGVGKLQKGEGIMSMAHAFAYAGCPSIIMSLWQVNDHSTAKLMEGFYQNLAQNKFKSASLREAKLDFLAEADAIKAHPYYWAGIVSIGDQRPLQEKGLAWWIWGIGIIFLITILSLYLRKKNWS